MKQIPSFLMNDYSKHLKSIGLLSQSDNFNKNYSNQQENQVKDISNFVKDMTQLTKDYIKTLTDSRLDIVSNRIVLKFIKTRHPEILNEYIRTCSINKLTGSIEKRLFLIKKNAFYMINSFLSRKNKSFITVLQKSYIFSTNSKSQAGEKIRIQENSCSDDVNERVDVIKDVIKEKSSCGKIKINDIVSSLNLNLNKSLNMNMNKSFYNKSVSNRNEEGKRKGKSPSSSKLVNQSCISSASIAYIDYTKVRREEIKNNIKRLNNEIRSKSKSEYKQRYIDESEGRVLLKNKKPGHSHGQNLNYINLSSIENIFSKLKKKKIK